MASGSRKQNALSIQQKVKILEEVDRGGRSKTEICKEFGIPNSTLSSVIKNREKVLSAYERGNIEPSRKRLRLSKHSDLDEGLLLWFKQARAQNIPLSGPLLMEKADNLALEMGFSFKSNPGWLERFKRRHGIVFKSVCGEAKQVSTEMTSEWLSSILPKILKDYNKNDIFNADEAGVFFRCLPEKTLAFKGDTCSGGKKSKERITVLVGCNSDGSEKLPLLVIGKYQNPRCFKDVKNLPVEYTANKKAWMTADIFSDWLKSLDKRFSKEKRKVALIIDNCPAHPDIQLNSIKLIFLPPNTTSVLQPCDQGIIKNLKVFYKKLLLQKFLASIELKEDMNISILDALFLLRSAWKCVTSTTIANCFHHSGFISPTPSDIDNHSELTCETELMNDVSNIFDLVSSVTNISHVRVEDYLNCDDNIDTTPLMSEREISDIIKAKSKVEDTDSENEVEEDVPTPSAKAVYNSLRELRRFIQVQPDGNKVYSILNDLENYMTETIIYKNVQKKITDYFEKTNMYVCKLNAVNLFMNSSDFEK